MNQQLDMFTEQDDKESKEWLEFVIIDSIHRLRALHPTHPYVIALGIYLKPKVSASKTETPAPTEDHHPSD